MAKRFALTLVALAPLACGIPTAPPLPTEVTLRVGGAIRVSDLTLTFVGVVSDSRCPSDVVCIAIVAGDAVAKFTLSSEGGGSSTFELALADPSRRSRTEQGLTMEFKALDPYPVSTHPTSTSDYRARLDLRRE